LQKRKFPSRLHIIFTILVLIAFSTSLSAWMVQAQAEDGKSDGMPTAEKGIGLAARFDGQDRLRVIVELKVAEQAKSGELMTPSIHQAQRDVLGEVKSGGVRVIHEYDYIPFMALQVDRAAFEALQKNPNVIGIEEDVLMKPMLQQSVPLIGADDVWLEGVTGAGQVVAILDTGVDKNHPALEDEFGESKVVSEACYSTTDVLEGSTSLCPGGASASTASDSALPYETVCPSGWCDHGTHVAGIVAGDGIYNTYPIKGVAPDAQIIAIQVFSKVEDSLFCGSSEPCIGSYSSDQLMGLQRVYELRNSYSIAALNLSLGGKAYTNQSTCDLENSSYKAKVDLLKSAGIATIAASGNDGYTNAISSPACISSVISVGATTDIDQVAYYSNSASFLDLLAPGSSITSAVPGTGYATWNGTSMATPHVAGAWALLKSYSPAISVDNLLNIIKNTGVLITDVNSVVTPRIDVFGAYELLSLPAPENVSASDGDSLANVSLTWGAVENTSFYQVFRNPVNTPETATLIEPNQSNIEYTDSSANPGTVYYYWVKACNSSGCSDFSQSASGWRDYQTIPAPEGVSASDGDFTDKVQVSWYGVGDADSYTVFRNIENSFDSAEEMDTTTTNLYFNDLTAESGESYYYWVTACDESNCSTPSISDVGYRLQIFNVFLPLTLK